MNDQEKQNNAAEFEFAPDEDDMGQEMKNKIQKIIITSDGHFISLHTHLVYY